MKTVSLLGILLLMLAVFTSAAFASDLQKMSALRAQFESRSTKKLALDFYLADRQMRIDCGKFHKLDRDVRVFERLNQPVPEELRSEALTAQGQCFQAVDVSTLVDGIFFERIGRLSAEKARQAQALWISLKTQADCSNPGMQGICPKYDFTVPEFMK